MMPHYVTLARVESLNTETETCMYPVLRILRSVELYLLTDVSEQHVGPTLRVKWDSIICSEMSTINYNSTLPKVPQNLQISFTPRGNPGITHCLYGLPKTNRILESPVRIDYKEQVPYTRENQKVKAKFI